jgi:hypothetical protein
MIDVTDTEYNIVNLTESGLAKCQKPVHDWD